MSRKPIKILKGYCATCGKPLNGESENHDCLFASTNKQIIENRREWVNKVQDVAKQLRRVLRKRDTFERPFNELSQQSRTHWHRKAKQFLKHLKLNGYILVCEDLK